MPIFRKQRLSDYRMPDDKIPRCPHCDRSIDGMMSREIVADLGKAYTWACPHCLAILGVTHRKGFWMG